MTTTAVISIAKLCMTHVKTGLRSAVVGRRIVAEAAAAAA